MYVDCDKRAYDLVCTQSLYILAPSLLRRRVQKSLHESALSHHNSDTNTDQYKDKETVIHTKRANRMRPSKNGKQFE